MLRWLLLVGAGAGGGGPVASVDATTISAVTLLTPAVTIRALTPAATVALLSSAPTLTVP